MTFRRQYESPVTLPPPNRDANRRTASRGHFPSAGTISSMATVTVTAINVTDHSSKPGREITFSIGYRTRKRSGRLHAIRGAGWVVYCDAGGDGAGDGDGLGVAFGTFAQSDPIRTYAPIYPATPI